MCTRNRLVDILTTEEVQLFNPNLVLNGKESMVIRLQKHFFSVLTDIFSHHPGERMLLVRRRNIDQGEEAIIQTHLYLGILVAEMEVILSSSGGVCLPTSRYVDSSDSLSFIKKSRGIMMGKVFGENFIWLFHQPITNGYALDLFIGDAEVDQWFVQRERTQPYLCSYLLKALGLPRIGGNFPLQFGFV